MILAGELNGITVVVMKGRLHYYEGYKPEEIVFPLRTMKRV